MSTVNQCGTAMFKPMWMNCETNPLTSCINVLHGCAGFALLSRVLRRQSCGLPPENAPMSIERIRLFQNSDEEKMEWQGNGTRRSRSSGCSEKLKYDLRGARTSVWWRRFDVRLPEHEQALELLTGNQRSSGKTTRATATSRKASVMKLFEFFSPHSFGC